MFREITGRRWTFVMRAQMQITFWVPSEWITYAQREYIIWLHLHVAVVTLNSYDVVEGWFGLSFLVLWKEVRVLNKIDGEYPELLRMNIITVRRWWPSGPDLPAAMTRCQLWRERGLQTRLMVGLCRESVGQMYYGPGIRELGCSSRQGRWNVSGAHGSEIHWWMTSHVDQ